MIKILFVIIFLFMLSINLFAKAGYINLSLRQAVSIALRKNPDLKLADLNIKKTKLDIKQQFIDLKDSELKDKRERLAVLQLENQRKDIIDTVNYEVQEKYYNCLIDRIAYRTSNEDLTYAKNYLNVSRANYQGGKIDKITFESIEENYKLKNEKSILNRGKYKRSLLAFLISINESLTLSINFTDSISENLKVIRFKSANDILLKNNRNINYARLNYHVKKLEYKLLDKNMLSKHDVERAKYNLLEAKIRLEQEIRKQKVELWSRYLQIKENEASLITLEKRMNRSKKAYHIAKDRYQAGYIPKNVLDNGIIGYKYFHLDYIKVMKEYNLSKLRFFFLFY